MAAVDYATVAEVRAYLGIPSSLNLGPDDTDIGTFITNASRTVDAYARRQFASTEARVEWFDTAFGLQHLILSHRPVVSLTSVQEADDLGVLTDYDIGRNRSDDEVFLSDPDSGLVQFLYPFTESLQQRIKVTYTSGYTLADIPAEVKQATIIMAARTTIRASLIDENCSERLKEMWTPLLKSTDAELREMLDLVLAHRTTAVAVFGEHAAAGAAWRLY